jgi:hypothetical protein
VAELLAGIAQRLVPAPPSAGAPVPFTMEQVAALRLALQGTQASDISAAKHGLWNLLA